MEMLDTNMVLRYLLDDNKEMADEAEKVIKKGGALVTIEVFAEVIYVLKGVYSIGRDEIKTSLMDFLPEIQTTEPEVLKLGLEIYAEHSLDFVDCILYVYNKVKGYRINTFDKKLKRMLEQTSW